MGSHLLRALAVLLQKKQQLETSAEMQGRGRKLAKKLKVYKFQLHLHLMWDILAEISKISLIFRKDAISISQVKAEIERASQALGMDRTRLGDWA